MKAQVEEARHALVEAAVMHDDELIEKFLSHGADSLTVDLEVLYSEVVTLPDGSCARRSGFQFLNADEKVWKLVDAFGAR